MKRVIAVALTLSALVVGMAACTSGGTPSSPSPAISAVASASPPSPTAAPAGTPRSTPRPEWPFEATFCAEAAGEPWFVVALGTSETAGWGVRGDEAYSPQDAYPGLYAKVLCAELGAPVELHSYFPSQQGNELAPLAWWINKVGHDEAMRADLAAAHVIVLWAMSSHNIVKAMFLPGACSGDWPDPLKVCLEDATGHIPSQTDELFGLIAAMVRDDATVLAGDAFAPPIIMQLLGDAPYRDEVRTMLDPVFSVEPAAKKFDFRFVDTELAFNGPSRWEMPADGLLQADELHLTLAGQQLAAATYAEQDGLGDR